jgi:hypothetical protein
MFCNTKGNINKRRHYHLSNSPEGDCNFFNADRYSSRAFDDLIRAFSFSLAHAAVWSRYLVRQSALLLERRRASLAFCAYQREREREKWRLK